LVAHHHVCPEPVLVKDRFHHKRALILAWADVLQRQEAAFGL
jgi:hypothetical protein